MEEYNRDGPQPVAPSWVGIVFWMIAGFLIGAMPPPFTALLISIKGGIELDTFVFLLQLTPLTALVGGLLGMGLAWKHIQPRK